MAYSISWKTAAARELRKLPRDVIGRVTRAVSQLGESPFPPGSVKMVGPSPIYRIRVGEYRVIYSVVAEALVVDVVKVGHRRDVYRR